jgi:hypothetical protein
MDLQVARAIVEQLQGYGLGINLTFAPTASQAHDGSVTLTMQEQERTLAVEVVSDADSLLRRERDALVDRDHLVVAGHVSSRAAEALRRSRVNYIDAAGNAFIAFDAVLIDVRGRRHPTPRSGEPAQEAATNLFSPKRAQVVFALLAWDFLARMSVVDLATAAGVSQGQAHGTLSLLRDAGYLTGTTSPRLDQKAALLDRWAAAHAQGLARTLSVRSFAGEVTDTLRKADPDDPVFASGEWAIPEIIRPTTMILYVPLWDDRVAIRNRWRTDGQPNIFVRKKFWRAPDRTDGPLGGVRSAPWPLIYADLVASGEPRQLVAAQEWRAMHAQP